MIIKQFKKKQKKKHYYACYENPADMEYYSWNISFKLCK